jgi:hypothetical protein
MTAPRFAESALQTLAAAADEARIEIVVHRGEPATDLDGQLLAVAREVEEGTAGVIAATERGGGEPPARPALSLAADGRHRIHYLAVPDGLEAPPFLAALMALADGGHTATRELLHGVVRPCEVVVFVAPGCPNCPHAVQAAVTVAGANEVVTLSVVDATAFPELAERHRVRSVPTTVIDGELALQGVVAVRKLARQIARRGSNQYGLEVFASRLSAGLFDALARRLAQGSDLHHFVALWASSTLEQRIGLMLVAEQTLAVNARALDGAVADLLPVLESADAARRGDTVDLLGTIGHRSAWPAIRALRDDPDPGVAEAAADVLGN